ncbi:MAG: spore cortex biosynthesis protein YabQ [Bacilli bacterium]
MNLYLQIQSLIFSFIYGIFFYITFWFSNRILDFKKEKKEIIYNLLFSINHVLLYFIILKSINRGSLHLYFLILFSIGFLVGKYICAFWKKKM